MADDDVNDPDLEDEVEPPLEEEFDEELVEDDDVGEFTGDADDTTADDTTADGDGEDDEDDDEPGPAAKKKARDTVDDEDDEDLDPDDVEADLDTILKDRIAAADDEEEEDEAEPVDPRAGEQTESVAPKRADEFMCTGCFLLVTRAQFGPSGKMECPVGEEDCPALTELLAADAKR